MAVCLQKMKQTEGIEMYLKNGEEIQVVPSHKIRKEESSEFEMDQIVYEHFGHTITETFGPIFQKYNQQEEEGKLRKQIFSAQKLVGSVEKTASGSERRKAAQVEICSALRQASLLAEVTGQFRSASLSTNSASNSQSLRSHVTVSTSSQTTLFNDSDRNLVPQNKVFVANSIYANAERILSSIDYLREKIKSRRQQLQYMTEISMSSRKVSYFDKVSQQEHQPIKHQLAQSFGRKSANTNKNVLFQKRFNCLQDILAIDCSRSGLYAHPQNSMKLLPIPSIYSMHLLQLAIETPPVYTIHLELRKVKTQELVASFNSWEGTEMCTKLNDSMNEKIFSSMNLIDILCAKQDHSNEMFAIFKLLMVDTKELPVSLVKFTGRLDRQFQEEFINKTHLTYCKEEQKGLSIDANVEAMQRTGLVAHFGNDCIVDEHRNFEASETGKIVEGVCVDHIIITEKDDNSICCLINHEHSYKISLMHQSQNKQKSKCVSGRKELLNICLVDLQRSYLYNKEIMEMYHSEVNVLAVKNIASKVPDTVKLLPASLSLLQCQLVFYQLKVSLSATLQKCAKRWSLPIQYEWNEVKMEYKLPSSDTVTSQNCSNQNAIPFNTFLFMPHIKISLELEQVSKSRKSPFEDPNNPNLYYRSPLALYFSPTTKGYCLLRLLPEYDDDFSPLNEQRCISTPKEFDSIVCSYVIQYVARYLFTKA